MNNKIRKELESEGWEFGSVQDFLELSDQEAKYIDLKLALKNAIKVWRTESAITQKALAKLIDSSQSRVAKIEAGDASVSLDLMVRAFFATGADVEDLAVTISPTLRGEMNQIQATAEEVKKSMVHTKERISKLEFSVYQLHARLAVPKEKGAVTQYALNSAAWSTPKPIGMRVH